MSDAGDLLKKINENMEAGNAPPQEPAPPVSGPGESEVPEITDIGQSGSFKGKPSGHVWLQERPGSGWEAYDLGDRDQASRAVRDLKGQPLSQVRAALQKMMSDNLEKRGGSFAR